MEYKGPWRKFKMKMKDFFSKPFWKDPFHVLVIIIGAFIVYQYFEIREEEIRLVKEKLELDHETARVELRLLEGKLRLLKGELRLLKGKRKIAEEKLKLEKQKK